MVAEHHLVYERYIMGTFLTGVDANLEDLLPWWVSNVRKHNPNSKIVIANFGMSAYWNFEWCKHNVDEVIGPMIHPKCAWFYKPRTILELKDKSVAWLDIDCEVVAPCEDIWDMVTPGMIGLTRDWVRANWWATGVIVVNDRPKVNDRPNLLKEWHENLIKGTVRGDQEMLNEMIGIKPHEDIQELPQDYQWLRISLNKGVDSPTKKIIHWTGPKGKKFIRNTLMKGRNG